MQAPCVVTPGGKNAVLDPALAAALKTLGWESFVISKGDGEPCFRRKQSRPGSREATNGTE